MAMTIDIEKRLGRTVLAQLQGAGYDAVIGGGAPRDWYCDRLCQDIDIFIPYTGIHPPVEAVSGVLQQELERVGQHYDRSYFYVYSFFAGSKEIQLVFFQSDGQTAKEHVLNFPTNLSRAWVDVEDEGHDTYFELGHRYEVAYTDLTCAHPDRAWGLYDKYVVNPHYTRYAHALYDGRRESTYEKGFLKAVGRQSRLAMPNLDVGVPLDF